MTSGSLNEQKMLFSFIVPAGPADGSNSADYYKPRFMSVPLKWIEPWCSPGDTCWMGVNHLYEGEFFTAGETKIFNYDVSSSDQLQAELVYPILSDMTLTALVGPGKVPTEMNCGQGSVSDIFKDSILCVLEGLETEQQVEIQLYAPQETTADLRVSYDGLNGM